MKNQVGLLTYFLWKEITMNPTLTPEKHCDTKSKQPFLQEPDLDRPNPLYFDKFVPWMALQWELPLVVQVRNTRRIGKKIVCRY